MRHVNPKELGCVPPTYLEVEELLSDDAGEGGSDQASLDGPLRQDRRRTDRCRPGA